MPVILLAIFIDLVGFGMIVPILPFLVGDPLTGTAIISVYALAAFAVGPIWGRISDRVGRKPVLALTFLGAALAYLLLAFSTDLWMVFLARAISGAMSGNVGIVMAAMADVSTENDRGKAMGRIGAAFGLGFACGPGIGGYLSELGGASIIFLPGIAAASLSLLAMILTAIYVPETNPERLSAKQRGAAKPNASEGAQTRPETHWKSIIFSPGRTSLFVMFVVTAMGQSISFAIAPFWVESVLAWNAQQVGFLMMAVGIIIFVLQLWAVEPLFRSLGESGSLKLCSVFHIAGCLVIIFGPADIITAAIGFPLVMGALTISYPALNSLLSKRSATHIQGAALGLSAGYSSLGRIAGPVAAGALFTPLAPGAPFVAVAVTGIATFGWALWENKQRPHKRTAPLPE